MSSIKVGNLLVFLPFRSFLYFSLSFDISCWSTPHSSLGDSRSFLAVWESEQDTYSLASRTLSLSISMCRKMDKHRLNRKEPDRKFIIFIQRPLNTSLIPTSVSNLKHEMKFIQKQKKTLHDKKWKEEGNVWVTLSANPVNNYQKDWMCIPLSLPQVQNLGLLGKAPWVGISHKG